MTKVKKMWLRIISVILFLFSIIFGVTWKKTGYCLGDELLTAIGWKAWSNGTQGTHYAACYALVVMWISILIFSSTMDNKQKMFRYPLICFLAFLALVASAAAMLYGV